jgi:hypothetical protein
MTRSSPSVSQRLLRLLGSAGRLVWQEQYWYLVPHKSACWKSTAFSTIVEVRAPASLVPDSVLVPVL